MNEKRVPRPRRRRKPTSATIHVLPGVERRDIGNSAASEEVLMGALRTRVIDAIVVGKFPDGRFYCSSCDFNADAVVGKLFTAALWLASNSVRRKDGS